MNPSSRADDPDGGGTVLVQRRRSLQTLSNEQFVNRTHVCETPWRWMVLEDLQVGLSDWGDTKQGKKKPSVSAGTCKSGFRSPTDEGAIK